MNLFELMADWNEDNFDKDESSFALIPIDSKIVDELESRIETVCLGTHKHSSKAESPSLRVFG